ncbi:MAG: NTP transferase domain-containing protein [candidate division Zixibacteria bacterium]|nr:NTP transferase domain-containing protein [candidate division Zixibacteria bacterium]
MILAGGVGERFWPLSRRKRPKQLLPILGGKTLLEATIDRIEPDFPPERTWIVTGQEIAGAVREKVGQLPSGNIFSEPRGNNTCLAIGLAAIELSSRDTDATLVVLSADHAIEPASTLRRVLREGVRLAQSDDHLITIGITPTRAETGYGYIELGPNFATSDGLSSYQVEAFREKPDRTTAQDYYFDHRHLWNAGIFVWTAKSLLAAIEKYRPGVYKPLKTYQKAIGTPSQSQALVELYETAESVSIDVAVLEKADNVIVIKADLAWDDVGSWLSLGRLQKANDDSNVLVGPTVALDSFDSTVYNDTDELVCTFGISDLILVRTGKATLLVHKSRVDDMKALMEKLKSDERWQEYL